MSLEFDVAREREGQNAGPKPTRVAQPKRQDPACGQAWREARPGQKVVAPGHPHCGNQSKPYRKGLTEVAVAYPKQQKAWCEGSNRNSPATRSLKHPCCKPVYHEAQPGKKQGAQPAPRIQLREK